MGAELVSVAEVSKALRLSASGKAAGPDGIPVALYKRCPQFVPLLADLFSAIGAEGAVPAAFLEGAITTLPKGGDASVPSNYRPITLLNTDYRLLAKVLAGRVLDHASDVISPTQTAFLRDRRIGDSIMLLQLLPHYLRLVDESALAAFLDTAKAYDTVNRSFLHQVMAALGAGAGLAKWVGSLLGDTKARAILNGYASSLHLFPAGVRQGCPLSPMLFLFVGEALFRRNKTQTRGPLPPAHGAGDWLAVGA
jgi:hypothetical protein